jgi:hypothetical protein
MTLMSHVLLVNVANFSSPRVYCGNPALTVDRSLIMANYMSVAFDACVTCGDYLLYSRNKKLIANHKRWVFLSVLLGLVGVCLALDEIQWIWWISLKFASSGCCLYFWVKKWQFQFFFLLWPKKSAIWGGFDYIYIEVTISGGVVCDLSGKLVISDVFNDFWHFL